MMLSPPSARRRLKHKRRSPLADTVWPNGVMPPIFHFLKLGMDITSRHEPNPGVSNCIDCNYEGI